MGVLVVGWLAAAAALSPQAVRASDLAAELRAALGQARAEQAARPKDPSAWQHLARAYSDLCDFQPDPGAARACARHALECAEQAHQLEPRNAEHELSIAIASGKLGLWGDAHEKAACARRVFEAATAAEALDPQYAWAHHVLGRWHREVADLNVASRLWVRWFLGGLPAASHERAVAELRRATELEPGEPAHWVELGFAEAAAGHKEAACAAWRRGLVLPATAPYQEESHERAEKALAAAGVPR